MKISFQLINFTFKIIYVSLLILIILFDLKCIKFYVLKYYLFIRGLLLSHISDLLSFYSLLNVSCYKVENKGLDLSIF